MSIYIYAILNYGPNLMFLFKYSSLIFSLSDKGGSNGLILLALRSLSTVAWSMKLISLYKKFIYTFFYKY